MANEDDKEDTEVTSIDILSVVVQKLEEGGDFRGDTVFYRVNVGFSSFPSSLELLAPGQHEDDKEEVFSLLQCVLLVCKTETEAVKWLRRLLIGDDVSTFHQAQMDPSVKNNFGTTALMLAAEKAWVDAADLLITAGAAVNENNRFGSTALHMAAWGTDDSRGRCVRLLLTSGAEPNVQNREGSTPLLEACMKGDSAPVSMLLDAGADVTAVDNRGRSALFVASGYGRLEVLDILASRCAFQLGLCGMHTAASPTPVPGTHQSTKGRCLEAALRWKQYKAAEKLILLGVGLLSVEACEYVHLCKSVDHKRALVTADRWRRRRCFVFFRTYILKVAQIEDEVRATEGQGSDIAHPEEPGGRVALDCANAGLLAVIGDQALAFKIATFL